MVNHIYIYGQIGVSSFEQGLQLSDIQQQYQKEAVEVIVHINSPGGDVIEGFAIHDFLKNIPQKVTTIVDGKCYSIATVILLAGDIRMMNPNAELMIHNPWGGIEGEADEIERYAQNVRKAEERLASFYAERLAHNVDAIKQLMKETTFMDLNEALNLGFVSKTVEPFHAVAFYNPEQKQKHMNISAEDKTWLQKSFDKIAAMFEKNGIKAEEQPEAMQNMVDIVLVGGDGEEKTAYVDSTDGELEGKSIFMDMDMTEPAPDGVHMLRDGRTIDVADGVIVSVREADAMEKEEDEEMQALKAELTNTKAELEELRASLEESQGIAAKAQKVAEQRASDMQTILAEMREIKARVIGATEAPAKAPVKATENKNADPISAQFEAWGNKIFS